MKISILVGESQEVAAAITAFNSFEEGVEWLRQRIPDDVPLTVKEQEGRRCAWAQLWRSKKLSEQQQAEWMQEHCFTMYYDGCGSVGCLTLKEIEPGDISFGFSLD